jgi:hypothetical protein
LKENKEKNSKFSIIGRRQQSAAKNVSSSLFIVPEK